MTEANTINQLLQNALGIQSRMQRDRETLENIRSNVQALLGHGQTTHDPVMDIVLRYGLPHEMEHLQKNLRRLDERLKQYPGQFILIELITPSPMRSKEPARHQTVVGVIATDQPTMRYVDEASKFSGIEIAVQSRQRILLSESVITEYKREDRPYLGALLNSGESFSIFIGHDAVASYLLPSYVSKAIPEEPKTRAARTERVARELIDLLLTHGMSIDEHHTLQDFIRSASHT